MQARLCILLAGCHFAPSVLAGDAGVLLVDAEWPELHDKVLAAVGHISSRPVRPCAGRSSKRRGSSVVGCEGGTVWSGEPPSFANVS